MRPDPELTELLARRPLMVVLAGPNGAGKSTYFHAHLADCGLPYVNADLLARALGLDDQHAAATADSLRAAYITQRESFITETVFSDPVGAKLGSFIAAQEQGYTVVLLFIGISNAERSDERVAMRVSQGGHDVPPDRIVSRFPRVLANLRAALPRLSAVIVYDNDDLLRPYRHIASLRAGHLSWEADALPDWWQSVRPPS